jgi:hypothetical protein
MTGYENDPVNGITCGRCAGGFGLGTSNKCETCIVTRCLDCSLDKSKCRGCVGGYLLSDGKCENCMEGYAKIGGECK